MSAIYDRQNDDTAMTYLRAAHFCKKQEYAVTYYMVLVSVLLPALSIAIRYLKLPDIYSTIVVIGSGVILISNIMFSYLKYVYSVEGVNLQERYDIYVFNLYTNKALLRSMGEQTIISYARRYRKRRKIAALRNFYFKTPEDAEDRKACIMNIKQQLAYTHRLMISVRTFFMFLWVLFPVALISVAFVIDGLFTDTVVNLFIPSLSAISMIASAFVSFNEQTRRVSNAINVVNEMLPNGKKEPVQAVSYQSPLLLRSLQDALFHIRLKEFLCPKFLIRRFDRMLAREQQLLNTEILLNNPLKSSKRNSSAYTVKTDTASKIRTQRTSSTANIKRVDTVQHKPAAAAEPSKIQSDNENLQEQKNKNGSIAKPAAAKKTSTKTNSTAKPGIGEQSKKENS